MSKISFAILALFIFTLMILSVDAAHAYYRVVDESNGVVRVVSSWIGFDDCMAIAEHYGLVCEWVEE